MKRFVQPNMYRLLRNGSRDEYHLADRAEEIAWELHKVLSVFEPCGDDDNRSIWLEVPRGKITDWMTYDDAKEYEDVTTREEYERTWKECYPCETQWVRLTTAVYENNVFLHLSDGERGYAHYRGDEQGHYLDPVFFEYLEMLLNEVRTLVQRVLEDVDAYNVYVEKNLPKQIREGRILRKDIYRILPWRRPELENKDGIVKMLQDCKTYSGAPLHIDYAERLLAAVEETDYVRLTSYTFHNYLNWQEETSVYSLPWEYQCDYKEYGVTREQLKELIRCSEWMPERKLKIQHKVPLESPLYDLMREKVSEPMFLYDIRMMMWKDYDGYVGTFHYSEFAKNEYRPYLNGSKIQQVYETWSEAITAGLLELIERRKNDI